jgi:hypothetical protein
VWRLAARPSLSRPSVLCSSFGSRSPDFALVRHPFAIDLVLPLSRTAGAEFQHEGHTDVSALDAVAGASLYISKALSLHPDGTYRKNSTVMSSLLSESDILFPHLSNTPNLSSTLSSLRRSTLSIHNRLSSIISDSEFVASVASAYNLPLVANERCGSWYIPPEEKTKGVYFKSTDGHMGQWKFSLRRLNLQLLDVVENWGGAVVVDSTRRGKSMPDALSKSIPIWCCVINRTVFGGQSRHELFTPPQAVSESEHTQMEDRIDGFVQHFLVYDSHLLSTMFNLLRSAGCL